MVSLYSWNTVSRISWQLVQKSSWFVASMPVLKAPQKTSPEIMPMATTAVTDSDEGRRKKSCSLRQREAAGAASGLSEFTAAAYRQL